LLAAAFLPRFFSSFDRQIDAFPRRCAKHKILPQLLGALEYGAGMSCFATILTSVLKIGCWLSKEEYAEQVQGHHARRLTERGAMAVAVVGCLL